MSAQLTDITMDAAPAPAPAVTPIAQPTSAAANRDSRIHTHSHIKGLGLGPDGSALPISQGFVGQTQAREALGIHLGLLREGRYSGRPLLLVGPPGTGKVSERASGERSRPEGERSRPKGDDERWDPPQPRPSRRLVSSRAKREYGAQRELVLRAKRESPPPSGARRKSSRAQRKSSTSEARIQLSSVASIPSREGGTTEPFECVVGRARNHHRCSDERSEVILSLNERVIGRARSSASNAGFSRLSYDAEMIGAASTLPGKGDIQGGTEDRIERVL